MKTLITGLFVLGLFGGIFAYADEDGELWSYIEIRTLTYDNGPLPDFTSQVVDYPITDPWVIAPRRGGGYCQVHNYSIWAAEPPAYGDYAVFASQTMASWPPSRYAHFTDITVIYNAVPDFFHQYYVWNTFGPADEGEGLPTTNGVAPRSLGEIKATYK